MARKYDLTNKKMSRSVYQQRRRVIEIIYKMKDAGIELPRITVRIAEDKDSILGVAVMRGNTIWITDRTVRASERLLAHVVAHEIGHAVYGWKHDESCPLMMAKVNEDTAAGWATILRKFKGI